MLVDLDGFPNLPRMETWLIRQNRHVFQADGMACLVKVLQEGRFFVRFRMFLKSLAQVPFSFTNVKVLAILTGNVIHYATFFTGFCFVFWFD